MNRVRKGYYRSEYVDGNTVRQAKPYRERRDRIEEERVRQNQKEIRAGKKALTMNAPHVIFLAVVSLVCLIMCVTYLHLQSDISKTRTSISTLKNQIGTVQSQNDALNYSINSYVDVDNIYKIATTKLGMRQAKDDQIINYKSSDSGYTIQYGEIPNK